MDSKEGISSEESSNGVDLQDYDLGCSAAERDQKLLRGQLLSKESESS